MKSSFSILTITLLRVLQAGDAHTMPAADEEEDLEPVTGLAGEDLQPVGAAVAVDIAGGREKKRTGR